MGIGSREGGRITLGVSTGNICTADGHYSSHVQLHPSRLLGAHWAVPAGQVARQLMPVTGSWILVSQGSPKTWSVCP